MKHLYSLLVRQTFVAIGKENNATIRKPMLEQVMLHDGIVTMGIYADRACAAERPIHHAAEDAMHPGQTGQPVYDMIWQAVKPSTTRTAGMTAATSDNIASRICRMADRDQCTPLTVNHPRKRARDAER